ncbi:hypothetical protein MODO_2626 [Myroides odoratimimus]|nr:hypothetical protein MODO_2626 [Myroides odoratimimus]
MVQLKAIVQLYNCIKLFIFQYLYGAVKRTEKICKVVITSLFQYLYGAVKSGSGAKK